MKLGTAKFGQLAANRHYPSGMWWSSTLTLAGCLIALNLGCAGPWAKFSQRDWDRNVLPNPPANRLEPSQMSAPLPITKNVPAEPQTNFQQSSKRAIPAAQDEQRVEVETQVGDRVLSRASTAKSNSLPQTPTARPMGVETTANGTVANGTVGGIDQVTQSPNPSGTDSPPVFPAALPSRNERLTTGLSEIGITRGQDPQTGTGGSWPSAQRIPPGYVEEGAVQPAGYQYPELGATGPLGPTQLPSEQLGAPNEPYTPIVPYARSGVATFPQNYADLDIYVTEGQTGRINIGGAYNSDNGLVGQFVIDERNFDIRRFPRSGRDLVDGTAWRGGGQGFRLELVPGNLVQRYMVNFTEPYFLDTPVSLSVSGFLFSRNYFDWNEQRLGGRVALGYRLTQDLSVSLGLRMEDVKLFDPRVNTSAQLNDALGSTDLFMGQFSIVNDTRDHPFLPTEGSFLSLTYSQAFGEVSFPRGDIEFRKYHLIYSRPDSSGRHTLSYGTRLGFSGSDTPIFENYFAGGFSTMRGFNFRGMGPTETGVRVGGEFQFLNTVEYMFPLTADDMIRGVVFCDYGTVEEKTRLAWDTFRIAPGFGFRIFMPAAGFGAPLAFDFAFPVNKDDGDDTQVFSFYMGINR